MNKFDGVANTLFVPLVARINISKNFQNILWMKRLLSWRSIYHKV